MKKQLKEQKGNIIRERDNIRERYEIITNYHLLDKRLTPAEKGVLTMLYILPNKWKITTKATSEYLNISEKTFITYLKKLTEIGYIETKKTGKNQTTYIIKSRPSKADFDIRNIHNYTIQQLNSFLNDNGIEQRYKALIKKMLGIATETNEQFNKLVAELEEQEQPQDAENKQDNIKLPF